MVKRKSRFLVFILSPMPGLSHLYLGWQQRALVYFMSFLGICVGGVAIAGISRGMNGIMAPLIFFAAALVWFSALAEAMHLALLPPLDGEIQEEGECGQVHEEVFFMSNRKLMALAFSVIPGAGHMFLGLLKEGAQLMAAFFLVLVLGGWLDFSLFSFLAPVIWFYSLFDIYHILEEERDLQLEGFSLFQWFPTHPQWVGWGLIILGLLAILQRLVIPVLEPLLTENLRNLVQTSFIALILIGGGIKLLLGSKVTAKEDEAQ